MHTCILRAWWCKATYCERNLDDCLVVIVQWVYHIYCAMRLSSGNQPQAPEVFLVELSNLSSQTYHLAEYQ